MKTTLRRLCLTAILALITGIATVIVPAGAAHAAVTSIETMPLWRLQVRVVTGDISGAGTYGNPAFRFNGTSTGVRTLNPPVATAFTASRDTTTDLRLFDTPSQMTMLRVGIATDAWCVKKIELIFNNRVAFSQDSVPNSSGACVSIVGNTYLQYTSAELRNNPAWKNYGTPPPLPNSMSPSTFWQMTNGAIGSAMLSSHPHLKVVWNPAKPLTVVRKNANTLGISYGITIHDLSGIESSFDEFLTFDVRLLVGADGNLHAQKVNPSCCYHYSMSDSAITQIDTALSRMSVRPAPHAPLRFSISTVSAISWTYTV